MRAAIPTINSQIVTLKALGTEIFYNVASPKFAAQAIRKVSEIDWKPLHFLFYGSQSISAVLSRPGRIGEFDRCHFRRLFQRSDRPSVGRWRITKEFLAWL
jgi:branched-chain amino acid transport system substrate-binding protein